VLLAINVLLVLLLLLLMLLMLLVRPRMLGLGLFVLVLAVRVLMEVLLAGPCCTLAAKCFTSEHSNLPRLTWVHHNQLGTVSSTQNGSMSRLKSKSKPGSRL
jgi:hypothetical protein